MTLKKKKKIKHKVKHHQQKKEWSEDDDPELRHYNEEINSLKNTLENLEIQMMTISTHCEVLLWKRNASKSCYEAAISDKEDVISFLMNYLNYLVDKKEALKVQKDAEDSQTSSQISTVKKCVEELNEYAEELGQNLAMDKILHKGQICALDNVKAFRQNLLWSIETAEKTLSEQATSQAPEASMRDDHHYNATFNLLVQSERFVGMFRKEYKKGYNLTRTTKYKAYLKSNLENRVLFRKFSDAAFTLYRKCEHFHQMESELNQELDFVEKMKTMLNKEFKKQEREMSCLEQEHHCLSSKSADVEAKESNLKELRKNILDLHMEVRNLKESEQRLQDAIRDMTKEVKEEARRCNLIKGRFSKLISVMKSTETFIRSAKFIPSESADASEDGLEELQNELLELLDTSQYERLLKNTARARQESNAAHYPLVSDVHRSSENKSDSEKFKSCGIHLLEQPCSEQQPLNASEAKILSELGLFKNIPCGYDSR